MALIDLEDKTEKHNDNLLTEIAKVNRDLVNLHEKGLHLWQEDDDALCQCHQRMHKAAVDIEIKTPEDALALFTTACSIEDLNTENPCLHDQAMIKIHEFATNLIEAHKPNMEADNDTQLIKLANKINTLTDELHQFWRDNPEDTPEVDALDKPIIKKIDQLQEEIKNFVPKGIMGIIALTSVLEDRSNIPDTLNNHSNYDWLKGCAALYAKQFLAGEKLDPSEAIKEAKDLISNNKQAANNNSPEATHQVANDPAEDKRLAQLATAYIATEKFSDLINEVLKEKLNEKANETLDNIFSVLEFEAAQIEPKSSLGVAARLAFGQCPEDSVDDMKSQYSTVSNAARASLEARTLFQTRYLKDFPSLRNRELKTENLKKIKSEETTIKELENNKMNGHDLHA